MANLSAPEIEIDYGVGEGQQESSLDTTPTTTKPLYSVRELVNWAQIALYWLGLVSNVPILVIFFKQGFSSSTNIGFFSLALTDLSVCVVYIVFLTSEACLYYWEYFWYFWGRFIFQDMPRELYAWIAAVIVLERLCIITLPEKMKRRVTPKVTVRVILAYLLLLVIDMIVYFFLEWIESIILRDPCTRYYDYKERRWVWNAVIRKSLFLVWNVHYYAPLILSTIPSVIVFVMLVLELIVLAVVFKRSADLRKPLVAEKEQVDATHFTRLTICIFTVSVKHVFTSGPTTIVSMMSDFDLLYGFVYFEYCEYIFNILLAINHSTNFFVYLVLNPKFRNEFRKIIGLKRRRLQS